VSCLYRTRNLFLDSSIPILIPSQVYSVPFHSTNPTQSQGKGNPSKACAIRSPKVSDVRLATSRCISKSLHCILSPPRCLHNSSPQNSCRLGRRPFVMLLSRNNTGDATRPLSFLHVPPLSSSDAPPLSNKTVFVDSQMQQHRFSVPPSCASLTITQLLSVSLLGSLLSKSQPRSIQKKHRSLVG
jgi:hypothetical protein